MSRVFLHRAKLAFSIAWQCLQGWNDRNSPPLTETELKRTFESARRYPYNNSDRDIGKQHEQVEGSALLKRINEIEDPRNLGKYVTCNAIISSTSIAYAVPSKLSTKESESDAAKPIVLNDDEMLLFARINSSAKRRMLDQFGKGVEETVKSKFMDSRKYLQRRHQRDIVRIFSLIYGPHAAELL